VAFTALGETRIRNPLIRGPEVAGAMAAYAEPMIDLSRVQLNSLIVRFVCRIAFLLVTVCAFLKLVGPGDALYSMMTTDAGNSGAGLVSKGRIGIDFGFMFPVIKQHRAPASGRVEFDCDALGLALRGLFATEAPGYSPESVRHYHSKPQDQNSQLDPHRYFDTGLGKSTSYLLEARKRGEKKTSEGTSNISGNA